MASRGRIVAFSSNSGYKCKGILYDIDNAQTTIIHIHGSYGNFYDNQFIQEMAAFYNHEKMNLLAFNMETHGAVSDGFKNGCYSYFGGAISSYETSVDDIEGAIRFASTFSKNIILQGHSQGTDKIINYLLKTNKHYPVILLSPCDSYRLQELWIAPEKIEDQIRRIRDLPDNGFTWLDPKEFGIKSGEENYYIPITKDAFLSLADGFNFRGFRYETEDMHFLIEDDVFIYVGGKDPFQTSEWRQVERFFAMHISSPAFHYYAEGNHDMDNIVANVSKDIISWIHSIII